MVWVDVDASESMLGSYTALMRAGCRPGKPATVSCFTTCAVNQRVSEPRSASKVMQQQGRATAARTRAGLSEEGWALG